MPQMKLALESLRYLSVGSHLFLSRLDGRYPEPVCLAACTANGEQLLAVHDNRPCGGKALHCLQRISYKLHSHVAAL